MPLLSLEPFTPPERVLDHPADAAPGRWWVLHTRPRAEKTLARRLLDRDVPFFLPLYLRQWRNRGRQFRSYLPLFPGYVFLHGDDRQRLAALETNLVAQVLPAEDQGRLRADLRRVHQVITTGAPVTSEDRLEPGDPVAIVKGPYAGLEGTVLRRGKQLRYVVEIHLLRRAVSVEVESWMVEPRAAKAAAAG